MKKHTSLPLNLKGLDVCMVGGADGRARIKRSRSVLSKRTQQSKETRKRACERRAASMRLEWGTFNSRGKAPTPYGWLPFLLHKKRAGEKKKGSSDNKASKEPHLVEPTGIEPVSKNLLIFIHDFTIFVNREFSPFFDIIEIVKRVFLMSLLTNTAVRCRIMVKFFDFWSEYGFVYFCR